jgi:hypothetical protein
VVAAPGLTGKVVTAGLTHYSLTGLYDDYSLTGLYDDVIGAPQTPRGRHRGVIRRSLRPRCRALTSTKMTMPVGGRADRGHNRGAIPAVALRPVGPGPM